MNAASIPFDIKPNPVWQSYVQPLEFMCTVLHAELANAWSWYLFRVHVQGPFDIGALVALGFYAHPRVAG